MKIKIKGIATYNMDITKKQMNSPGFDIEKWAREELERQKEAFSPDSVEYSSYELVE